MKIELEKHHFVERDVLSAEIIDFLGSKKLLPARDWVYLGGKELLVFDKKIPDTERFMVEFKLAVG